MTGDEAKEYAAALDEVARKVAAGEMSEGEGAAWRQRLTAEMNALDRPTFWRKVAAHPFLILVAIVLILGIGGIVKSCATEPSGADTSAQTDALITCRKGVKNLLKNPTTASFSGESFGGSGATITYSGTVVEENSLGGKVTYTFSCDFYGGVAHVRPLAAR